MLKPILPLLLCVSLLWISHPATAQTLPSPSTLFKSQISFGSGGGVSGASKTYTIHEDGKVTLKESLTDSVTVLKTLSDFNLKEAFRCANGLKLDKYKFNHPGNLYYFIEYSNPKKKVKSKTVWGSNRHKVAKSVQKFYYKLIKML